VPLESLLRTQLAHFADALDRRIVLAGPPLKIKAAAAQTLGIILHELSTNAAKYGALSLPAGRVTLDWGVEKLNGGEPAFHMRWREQGVSGVQPPARRGFGSTVLEGFARSSLHAETATRFESGGLVWDLTCALAEMVEYSGAPSQELEAGGAAGAAATDRGRPRVLVVEDEALPALELASVLDEAGFDVLGPAGSVRAAVRSLNENPGCDAAVLDINLGSETSEPIARKLADAGIPFIAISGYSREQLPAVFAGVGFLSKPLDHVQLVREIRRMTGKAAAPTRAAAAV